MIHTAIRRWLGLDMIEYWNANIGDLANQVKLLTEQVRLSNMIIARLAVDPNFTRDELDPAKRAESDRLADETIRRLRGEDLARRHTTGDL